MLLSIIVILLLGLIAFFHYTQGLFASTVSAVCAAAAALIAFAYHETLVARFTGGAYAAWAEGVALVAIFAVIYIALRTFIDNAFPGNIRFPVALDKGGAVVLGLIAGFFSTAIIALAAQILPFGPVIAWYAPYPTQTDDGSVDRRLGSMYAIEPGDGVPFRDEVQVDRLTSPEAQQERRSLWIPVDDWFIGLVRSLSDQGSLAGPTRFDRVYPDYKQALFAQRLGMQRSATQAAINIGERRHVTVPYVFRVPIGDPDDEQAQFPGGILQVDADRRPRERSLRTRLQPEPENELIVVRIYFDQSAQDRGGYVRFSPGTTRLVIAGRQYFPIATLESALIAVNHKPDDFLLAADGVDFIYEVDRETAFANGELAPGAFLEFKRFARLDLGGRRLVGVINPDPNTHVLRKLVLRERISDLLAGRRPGERTIMDEFLDLRDSVPLEPGDPELIERSRTPDPSEDPGEADEEPQSPMDVIRGEAERRREIIEGGGDPD